MCGVVIPPVGMDRRYKYEEIEQGRGVADPTRYTS